MPGGAQAGDGLEVLGLVPARGGSKGLPRKNLLQVGGLSLVARAIACGLSACSVTRTIVSTDDAAIAEAALAAGGEIPFTRPADLATDESPTIDMVWHALDWLADHEGYRPDLLVLLQPTTPFRTAVHVDQAVGMCVEYGADSVVSVAGIRDHPYEALVMDSDARLRRFLEIDPRRFHQRQVMPPACVPNGAVYVARPSFLAAVGTFVADGSYAYVMDRWDSLDIDSEYDLTVARLLSREREG